MTPPHEAEVAFTAVVSPAHLITPADVRASKLFRTEPQTGLPGDLGAVERDSVVPWTLTPTNVFDQALLNRLRRDGLRVEEKKLPLAIAFGGASPARLSVRLSLFPPCVIVVTASVRGLALEPDEFPDRLIGWENSDDPYVRGVLAGSVGLICSLDHRRIADVRLGRIARTVRLRLAQPPETIRGFADTHGRELVGLAHHEARWRSTSDVLVERLLDKNAEINAHVQEPFRLIDKQAFVQVEGSPAGTPPFARLVQWQALALAFREFLGVYHARRALAPRSFDLVLAKIDAWVREPQRVIRWSVSGQETWKLVCDELRLDQELARTVTPGVRERLDQAAPEHDALGRGWWSEPELEASLAGADSVDLSAMRDANLRSLARRSSRDAQRAYLANAPTASILASRHAAQALLRDGGIDVDGLVPGLPELVGRISDGSRAELELLLRCGDPEDAPPDADRARRSLTVLAELAEGLR